MMRMELRPMMFMAMNCTECGRALSKPSEAADDDSIDEDVCAALDPATAIKLTEGITKICPKCRRPFKVRKKKK